MTNNKEQLFNRDLLTQAHFPKLTEEGRIACTHEVELWGFQGFLDDGWGWIELNDPELHTWLSKMIEIEKEDIHPEYHSCIDKSLKYGASIIYYPLFIQTNKDSIELPTMMKSQIGSLKSDLSMESSESLGEFLAGFDENLASIIGGMIANDHLLQLLEVDKEYLYQGAYFIYYALAHAAEQNGLAVKLSSPLKK